MYKLTKNEFLIVNRVVTDIRAKANVLSKEISYFPLLSYDKIISQVDHQVTLLHDISSLCNKIFSTLKLVDDKPGLFSDDDSKG